MGVHSSIAQVWQKEVPAGSDGDFSAALNRNNEQQDEEHNHATKAPFDAEYKDAACVYG